MLSLLDNSSDSEIELSVNKDYANKYNEWRQKEELQKYKDLKKDEEESESSSESSSEEIDEEFDEEFFRALSLLKGKDPRIFDKNFHLFQKKEILKKQKHDKPKPIYMKDYERNLVLERGGKFSDEDESANLSEKVSAYNEEQENLKKSFKEALGSSDDSESDADDLLQVRNKTIKEEENAEADYVKWLKGEEKEVSEDVKKNMSHLRNYWNDPKLDEGEKFLKDYILNKRYLDKDGSEIPTYEELTSGMLSDDEKMIAEQEQFEHKYNFRFEEPDEEYIKQYPRTIGDSLRRVDNRRKQKREDKTERRRKEREQRREELKRLKALKRKEIEEKFMKLKEISGQDEINLNEDDIESDFDPDKHDQKMKEMFNDKYYEVEEDQKPEFPYDEELDSENWNAWTGEKMGESEEEGESISDNQEKSQSKMCANPKDDFANEMTIAAQPRKKVKKKSLFAKIISQPKPVYDPSGKSFEEYLDEYYKLDYEDIVGDIPVRYKYRKVIPNDFGLTVKEILAADDKELNRWCSVKKACQYRNDDEELYDVQAYKNKAQHPNVKQKFLPSIYAKNDFDDSEVSNDISKAKKKKFVGEDNNTADNQLKKVDNMEDSVEYNSCEKNITGNVSLDSSTKSKKKKKKFNASFSEGETNMPDFFQNKSSDLNRLNNESPCGSDEIGNSVTNSEKLKKPKKKNKKLKVSEKSSPVSDFFKSNDDDFSKSDLEASCNEFDLDQNKMQNYGEFKNSKNRKKKFKTSFSESETGLKIILSNESNLNTSTFESSCDDGGQDQGVVHSQEKMKKHKKKKPKEELRTSVEDFGCNNLTTVSESEYKDANTCSNKSQMTLETSHKNVKRKRKHAEDILPDSEKCDLTTEFPKSNKSYPSNDIAESSPNFASTNVSSSPPEKKKKKRKNKPKRNMLNNNTHNEQDNASNPSLKKSKDKYKTYASGDKRLGLSDERLAAYGINPKKFKNRIIYAKK